MIFSKFFTSKIKRTGRTEEIWYFCQCLKCSTKRVQNWTWVYLVTYSTQRGHTTSPSRIFPIWWGKKTIFWGFSIFSAQTFIFCVFGNFSFSKYNDGVPLHVATGHTSGVNTFKKKAPEKIESPDICQCISL